jgi:octaprenyl-diphosphate synthase
VTVELTEILDPIAGDLARVEEELNIQVGHIKSQARGEKEQALRSTVDYFFGVPGKRLRPALTLLTARALGHREPVEPLIQAATAAELIHSASLVHDDVIDQEGQRRGQPTLNSQEGNTIAVLVGDLYYAQFFTVLTELTSLGTDRQRQLFELFLDTTRRMCLAEILEARLARAGQSPSFSDYLQIVEDKTASLMSASCAAAAIVAGADEKLRGEAASFGRAIGLAYQLVDDTLDGDASYRNGTDILDRAEVLGSEARERLERLPSTRATGSLEAMVAYVLEKVRILSPESA